MHVKFSMAEMKADILMNHIFMKLPFKSILRCRCVCKEWLRILTDPYFVKMHVNDQLLNHQRILLGPIIYNKSIKDFYEEMRFYKKGDEYFLERIHAFSGVFYSVDPESQEENKAVRLPGFDLKDEYAIHSVLGNCNGIICAEVAYNWVRTRETLIDKRRLLFGNPSTGVYKILPDLLPGPIFIAGFGYVSSTDDYKFVRVDYTDRITRIYSLKSNSWSNRVVGDDEDKYVIEPDKKGNNIGFGFDGSIYWLVPKNNVMVEFDLKDEEFKKVVPLPTRMRRLSAKLVTGGSVSLISIHEGNDEILDKVEIWSMEKKKEELDKSSSFNWIKRMTVRIPNIFGINYELHPLYIMKDDHEKVLCCFRHHKRRLDNVNNEVLKYVLIDPKSDTLGQDFTISGISCFAFKDYTFHHQTPFINSFVSPC